MFVCCQESPFIRNVPWALEPYHLVLGNSLIISSQEHFAYRVFYYPLYGTTQRTCSVLYIVALSGYLFYGFV